MDDQLKRLSRSEMKCSGADWCDNPVLAKGLCNAHYIRNRTGKSLSTLIAQRKKSDRNCTVSGCKNPVGKRGAHDMCKNHYLDFRSSNRKMHYIKLMGPECQMCRGIFQPCCYDFHHKDPMKKEDQISAMFRDASDKKLSEEISKCILLCSNCHRIEHYGQIQQIS